MAPMTRDIETIEIPGRAFFFASLIRFFARDSKFIVTLKKRGIFINQTADMRYLNIKSFMTSPADCTGNN